MSDQNNGLEYGHIYSRLPDPRRIQLRRFGLLDDYHSRGNIADIVELCHELTKLRPTESALLQRTRSAFESLQTVLIRHDRKYPLQPELLLPEPKLPDTPISEAIQKRRSVRSFSDEPVSMAILSMLLFGALGESERLEFQEDAGGGLLGDVSLRTIASAGAIHPTELYAIVHRGTDVNPGVYRYHAPRHSLEVIQASRDDEWPGLLRAFPTHPETDLTDVSAIFVFCSRFWRSRAKYGARGYRYALIEAGLAAQNLCLTAVAIGLAHVMLGGFWDDSINELLGIDGVDESAIIAVATGSQEGHRGPGASHGG